MRRAAQQRAAIADAARNGDEARSAHFMKAENKVGQPKSVKTTNCQKSTGADFPLFSSGTPGIPVRSFLARPQMWRDRSIARCRPLGR